MHLVVCKFKWTTFVKKCSTTALMHKGCKLSQCGHVTFMHLTLNLAQVWCEILVIKNGYDLLNIYWTTIIKYKSPQIILFTSLNKLINKKNKTCSMPPPSIFVSCNISQAILTCTVLKEGILALEICLKIIKL